MQKDGRKAMFHWEDGSVVLMKNASEYGDYFQKLAEKMLPDLREDMHICDAGCGLGYLSLELAKYVREVTSIDIAPQALAVLQENCEIHDIKNVHPILGDLQQNPPKEPYDAMVFCFFGNMEKIVEIAKEQCKQVVFVITKNYEYHRFSNGKYPVHNCLGKTCEDWLKENKIAYQGEKFALEFGQPFKDKAEARRFFELYSKDDRPEDVEDQFLEERLIPIKDGTYAYYLPHQKEIAFYRIRVEDMKK